MQNIVDRRLFSQLIAGEKPGKPEQVVKHLGAMQAQDYHQALWAIGLRMPSGTVSDIEQSIADHKMILTWPMRGTLHFVPSEDVKWTLKLSASRTLAQDNRRLEQLELNQGIIQHVSQIIYDVLYGNKRKSRPELMQLLEEEGISTKNQRGYHLLWYIAQSGLICHGPREGKLQTFVLLDEWAPDAKELSMEESIGLLAERYFTGHGPATVQDFAWWAGITLSTARQGVEAAKPCLVSEKIKGQEYWGTESLLAGSMDERPSVYLLPGYDEYLLGYKDRSAVLRTEFASRIIPGNNGVFMATIVIDGHIAGIWKRSIKNKGIDIEFDLFTPLADREESIIKAAERYCSFMGLPLASTSFI
ncbi:winged helix DNA-binding domain-containing protein [Paenibacillus lutimineralis]|uniref:Winged helix DNA-binding domain-containing protein n=1 Tax=Paenibacillus lutimineralis TaxID=2707005 RepID=A0A3S9UY09_9BACL|nr:winged helix DNA-binding domain-containing protein [Paenibacillus lutimineralis]AZS15222.1 winged helix DNA-binding domain-containing protein [Paenibacillus lutimineralis]